MGAELGGIALGGLFDLIGGVGQGLAAPEQQERQSFGSMAPGAAGAFQNNFNVLNDMNRSALGSPVNLPRTPNVFAGMNQQQFRLPGSGQTIGLGPNNRILNNGVTTVWERAQNRGNYLGQAGGGVPDAFAGGAAFGGGGGGGGQPPWPDFDITYPDPGEWPDDPVGGGDTGAGMPPDRPTDGGGQPPRLLRRDWQPMQGLAAYQTMPGTARQIPGPPGQPQPIMAHGGEVIGRPPGPVQGGPAQPPPGQPTPMLPAPQARPMTPGATMPNVGQPVAAAPSGQPQQQGGNDEQMISAISLLGHLGAI